MNNEIELPDYLPSKYKSWYHLYLEVDKGFKEKGFVINEETKVKLFDLGSLYEQELLQTYSKEVLYFYQEFPMTLIKARALDYILSKIPDLETMYKIRNLAMSVPYADSSMFEIFNNLLDISPKQR